MHPMLWFCSPQINFPWSGSVSQDFDLDSFFAAIPGGAGDGDIEREAFKRHSYGQQIGWLTEVLLERTATEDAPAASPLGKLRLANAEIQRLKIERDHLSDQRIESYLHSLKLADGARFARISERLAPLFAAPLP